MTRRQCHGFKALPVEYCYAIDWEQWEDYFEEKYYERAMYKLKKSIIAHAWNKLSLNRPIKVGSRVAYGVLAERYCPKVYSSCGEFF